MKGLIYKVTNKIDNKAYIGQTIRPLNIRIERHLKDAKYGSKLIFHKALKKYGIEKFHIEILEENISQNKLNERERFWIKKYNTYFKNGYGYNMTEGGDYFNTNRKLSDDEISDIIYLLKKHQHYQKLILQKNLMLLFMLFLTLIEAKHGDKKMKVIH